MTASDTPLGPAVADAAFRLSTEIRRCPYHALLGLQALGVDANDGSVLVRLTNRPELGIDAGSDTVHGGVLAALVDVTAHAAVACAVGRPAPTVDLRVDYLRPARGSHLTARGRVLTLGRSIGRADVHVCDIDDRLVAAGRCTFSVRGSRDEGGA